MPSKFVRDPSITLRENADIVIQMMEEADSVFDLVELVYQAGRLSVEMDENPEDCWADMENAIFFHFASSFKRLTST